MSIVENIERLAEPIAARQGCDVVQVTYRREQTGWVLRVLIERKGADPRTGSGIDHSLCAATSRELGALLDGEDLLAEAFVLEVSSPGIERPLVKLADFSRFEGRPVKLETKSPVGGRKKLKGILGGVRGDEIVLIPAGGGDALHVSFPNIAKAHLVFENDGMPFRAGER